MSFNLLVIELYNLITELLQMVQMINLIFVTFYCLGVSLFQVHIFHSKQLLFMIKNLVDLKCMLDSNYINRKNCQKCFTVK